MRVFHAIKQFIQDKITEWDITLLLRQLATLINAGISIISSFELLAKSQPKPSLQHLIQKIKFDLSSGKTLSTCFKKYPQYFTELTCQLIQLGENTGQLDALLNSIALHAEKNFQLKRKIHHALFYPSILLAMTVLLLLGMFIFIIPKFAHLFNQMHAKIPLFTTGLFTIADQLEKHYLIFIIQLIILFALFIFLSYSKYRVALKKTIMVLILRLPLVNTIFKKMMLAQFIRNLSISFSAGIPIIDALALIAKTTQQKDLNIILAKLRMKICSGMQLHHAMSTIPYFSLITIQLIKMGEESGTLEIMLNKLVIFFESDVDQLLTKLTQLVEPLIMILLGVLIGGLVIGMYLPIFQLGTAL